MKRNNKNESLWEAIAGQQSDIVYNTQRNGSEKTAAHFQSIFWKINL